MISDGSAGSRQSTMRVPSGMGVSSRIMAAPSRFAVVS